MDGHGPDRVGLANQGGNFEIFCFFCALHTSSTMASVYKSVTDPNFDYIKSKPEREEFTLAHPAYEYQWKEINKQSGHATEIEYGNPVVFEIESGGHCNLSRSYFELVVRLQDQDGNNLSVASNVAPAALLPATLFESMHVDVCDKTVENITGATFAQTSAFLFRQMDTELQDEYGETAGWSSDSPGARQAAFERCKTQTYLWRPPAALFNQNAPLPPNTPLRVTLNVAPAAMNRALTSLLNTTTASGNGVLTGGVAAANVAGFKFESIRFHAAVAVGDNADLKAADGDVYIPLKRTQAISQAVLQHDATSYRFKVPRNCHKINVAFQHKSADTGTANHFSSATSFQTQPANADRHHEDRPTAIAVNTLQLEFGGQTAPSRPFVPTISADKDNLRLAYKEYADTLLCTNKESYETWLSRGAIFSYQRCNVRGGNDASTELNVLAGFDEAMITANPLNILVFAEFESTLVIESSEGRANHARLLEE